MGAKAVITVLIILGLVFLSEIKDYFEATGRCIIFARQNIQAYKTPKIRRGRGLMSIASVLILTMILYPEPCIKWAFIAGYLILRTALPFFFVRRVSDHDLFFGAFTAYYTFLPFAVIFTVLAYIIFTRLSWWDAYGWIPLTVIFASYFFRLIYVEFRLVRNIYSTLETIGFIALIELFPLAILSVCHFFA